MTALQTSQPTVVPVPIESVSLEDRPMQFVPFAEADAITITASMVKTILAVRSRSGKEPGRADIIKFMMLCKSRRLNPFVSDCYLLGYETKEGDSYVTKWNLITAIQALRKRAEGHPQYDGIQCGIIVKSGGEITEREGTVTLDGEILLGGWAVVYRKDRKTPDRRTVKRATYDTSKSRWAKDPEGMISKCAEAAALRAAFPSDLAGLYVRDEFDTVDASSSASGERAIQPRGIAGLKTRLAAPAPAPATEVDREEIQRQDEQSVDQRSTEDDGNQSEMAGDPNQMTPEEIADYEREQAASGRTRQSSLIEKGEGVGQ